VRGSPVRASRIAPDVVIAADAALAVFGIVPEEGAAVVLERARSAHNQLTGARHARRARAVRSGTLDVVMLGALLGGHGSGFAALLRMGEALDERAKREAHVGRAARGAS